MVSTGGSSLWFRERNETGEGLSGLGDDDFFAAVGEIDPAGEMGFGFVDVHGLHI